MKNTDYQPMTKQEVINLLQDAQDAYERHDYRFVFRMHVRIVQGVRRRSAKITNKVDKMIVDHVGNFTEFGFADALYELMQ